MSEMILPGVYIEVRPEALIVPGRVSVNNVGMVGTASRGPVNTPVLLGSYIQAQEVFGAYDAWDEDNPDDVLTLTRALELAFGHGATTVWAVRVGDNPGTAGIDLASAGGPNVRLEANSPGEWGNEIEVNVTEAEATSFVEDETHPGGAPVTLTYPVAQSARNRIQLFDSATRRTTNMGIVYEGTPNAGQALINPATGAVTFHADDEPDATDDQITVSYAVPAANSVQVTLRLGTAEEIYVVANGDDLARDITDDSAIATATAQGSSAELPEAFASADEFRLFGGGTNGVAGADYTAGLRWLLNENAHIIVAAGQSHEALGAELTQHVTEASNDTNKRERIGVTGSALEESFDAIRGHSLNSDRLVFVAPGIVATDAARRERVTLPGAYTAAAIAGLMASYDAHVSLTNKPLPVADLETRFTNPELKELLEARVMPLQEKLGFKVVRAITTSTNTAWKQITTRRIVDYAKFGVRSAADPYIGLLNNERVRGALRATVNSFLAEMVEDEMLISYDLNVSATREQERQGICIVTMVIRPVFSIDFIKVTMFLE